MATVEATLQGTPDVPLMVKLKRAERRQRLQALALIVPLALFLLLVFIFPLAGMLVRSVENPEVADTLPKTVAALHGWDGKAAPGEPVFVALSQDLQQAYENKTVANAAKRLNSEISGYRSLVMNTARKMPLTDAASMREGFVAIDARWGELPYWHAIARNTGRYTSYYLLAAVDHQIDDQGNIVATDPQQAVFLPILGRTLWMSLVVTVICIGLGYPLAYLLASLPARQSNLLMIMVLLPFWTSVLVRVAAWIVLLQNEGLINKTLIAVGITHEPIQLVFNQVGVYIAMVHIMLPFMILPVYSVMKGIPVVYVKAAISLGSHPFAAFWRIYFPQTLAGLGAGSLLVFIITIGYYITPALLGSPKEQMMSYFVAFYTNVTINWGMAAALGTLLLLVTLILYAVYSRLIGTSRLKLG
jgi:putative spermidine/putrescine transport system permease protein